MEKTVRFNLPDTIEHDQIIRQISEAFSTIREPSRVNVRTYFDTFDWRLHHDGYSLIEEDGSYHLINLPDKRSISKLAWNSAAIPKYWWDFPEGPLRDHLQDRLSGQRQTLRTGQFAPATRTGHRRLGGPEGQERRGSLRV